MRSKKTSWTAGADPHRVDEGTWQCARAGITNGHGRDDARIDVRHVWLNGRPAQLQMLAKMTVARTPPGAKPRSSRKRPAPMDAATESIALAIVLTDDTPHFPGLSQSSSRLSVLTGLAHRVTVCTVPPEHRQCEAKQHIYEQGSKLKNVCSHSDHLAMQPAFREWSGHVTESKMKRAVVLSTSRLSHGWCAVRMLIRFLDMWAHTTIGQSLAKIHALRQLLIRVLPARRRQTCSDVLRCVLQQSTQCLNSLTPEARCGMLCLEPRRLNCQLVPFFCSNNCYARQFKV